MLRSNFCLAALFASFLTVSSCITSAEPQTASRQIDGLSSQSYALNLVHQPGRADISYDRAGRFFVSEGREYIKIDATGRTVFTLQGDENSFRPRLAPFVVTDQGIYDLSATRPRPTAITQVVNGLSDKTLTQDSFDRIFAQAYRDADVFFVGEFDFEQGKTESFFRIDGTWIKFYLSQGDSFFVDGPDLLRGVRGYPAKYRRMFMLKDVGQKTYADGVNDPPAASIPEATMRFARSPQIEMVSYSPDSIDENFQYTPIPAVLRGLARHEIEVDGETITFSAPAVSGPAISGVDTFVWLYVLPSEDARSVPVSFLEYAPRSYTGQTRPGGVFVLAPK